MSTMRELETRSVDDFMPFAERLRAEGASDDEIADRWRGAMWIKKAGHGIDDEGFLQPDRPMSAIGG